MRRRFALAAVLAGFLMLAGVPTGVARVEDGARASVQCTHRAVASRIKRFAADYRNGRLDRADGAWAAEPEFEWYAAGKPGARLNAASRRRGTLRAYFERRIAKGERLRIRRIKSFYEAKRDIRHFNGRVTRSADDLAPASGGFKGAMSCASGKLIVWAMSAGAQ